MPIFEYKCQSCDHKFEKLVFGQTQNIECPECGSGSTEKLFSTFGFKSSGTFSSGNSGSCDSCHTHSCGTCNCH